MKIKLKFKGVQIAKTVVLDITQSSLSSYYLPEL